VAARIAQLAWSLKIGRKSENNPPCLFVLMSLMPNSVTAVCIFLMLAGPASIQAAPQGFMEGHLKIVVIRAVEPDNMQQPAVAPETYAEYPLIILNQEEKKEIARLNADKSGNYRVALPPGAYVLHVQERAEERAERIHANPQPFTVVSNQTVRVDMTIFIGPAKGQASAYSR
jgi:hypothetical protein